MCQIPAPNTSPTIYRKLWYLNVHLSNHEQTAMDTAGPRCQLHNFGVRKLNLLNTPNKMPKNALILYNTKLLVSKLTSYLLAVLCSKLVLRLLLIWCGNCNREGLYSSQHTGILLLHTTAIQHILHLQKGIILDLYLWRKSRLVQVQQADSEGTYQCKKTAPTQLVLSGEQLRMSGFQILTQYLEERKEDKLTTNTAHK